MQLERVVREGPRRRRAVEERSTVERRHDGLEIDAAPVVRQVDDELRSLHASGESAGQLRRIREVRGHVLRAREYDVNLRDAPDHDRAPRHVAERHGEARRAVRVGRQVGGLGARGHETGRRLVVAVEAMGAQVDHLVRYGHAREAVERVGDEVVVEALVEALEALEAEREGSRGAHRAVDAGPQGEREARTHVHVHLVRVARAGCGGFDRVGAAPGHAELVDRGRDVGDQVAAARARDRSHRDADGRDVETLVVRLEVRERDPVDAHAGAHCDAGWREVGDGHVGDRVPEAVEHADEERVQDTRAERHTGEVRLVGDDLRRRARLGDGLEEQRPRPAGHDRRDDLRRGDELPELQGVRTTLPAASLNWAARRRDVRRLRHQLELDGRAATGVPAAVLQHDLRSVRRARVDRTVSGRCPTS